MAEETREPRFNPSFATNYSTLKQEQAREREVSERERLGAGELWEATRESEWLVPRLSEQEQFDTSGGLFSDAEEPVIPAERLKKDLGADYTQQEQDFIAKATSEQDYQARIEKVAQDREVARKIGQEGWRGIGYSMMAGMTDPALLPLYVGTGGGAALGRLGLLARTMRAGALGAAEGAAVESVLATADTQRDWKDVVLAGVSGGVVSGSIPLGVSGYRRLRHGKEPTPNLNAIDRDPAAYQAANSVDSDLARMAKDYRDDQSITALENNIKIETLQSVDARQNLIDELMPIAQNRLSRGDRKPVEAEVTRLESQLDQLRREQEIVPAPEAGGTARQRKQAGAVRKARMDELQARMDDVGRRLQETQRVLDDDLPAREAWSDISRLAQGQVPKRYRDRLKELMDNDVTPLNRSESRRVREAAQRISEQRQRQADAEADAAIRRPEGEAQDDTGSVGAARVEGARNPEDAYPESGSLDVDEDLANITAVADRMPGVDRLRRMAGAGSRRLSSTYSRLAGSESKLIRGLGHMLLADPQAAARGHIAASHRVANYHDRLMAAEGGREAQARDMWAKEMGISPIRVHMGEESVVKDFDNAVVLQIRGQDQGSEAIRQAAKARQDVLEEALKMRKEAGERGFEEVESNSAYWSFVPDFAKMQSSISQYSPEEVIDTLTGAYMNGRFKLRERTARLVARATYHRTMRRGLTAEGASKYQLSNNDIGSIRADMEELGVSTRQIDDFLEEMESTELETSISNRAKLSLGASQSYVSQSGLRMVDLLDTSIHVTTKYGQEAAAGAALARTGFKSRAQAERAIDESEITAKNALYEEAREKGIQVRVEKGTRVNDQGRSESFEKYIVTRDGKQKTMSKEEFKKVPDINEIRDRADRIGEDAQQLRDSIKLMYGESLDVDIGKGVKLSRQARKVTNIIALQWNGFASMGEASNQLVNMGVFTTLRNTRAGDFLSFGKIRQSEDLQGMYKLVGAYGQYGSSVRDNNYTLQTMDEYNQSKVERIFNNGAGWVSNKTQLMSGFRSVQHGLENVLLRSMQDRLVRIADGKLKPKQRDFDEMERAGLSREDIDSVLKHIRDNPEYADVDGERVRIFSGEGMEPELRDNLGVAMTVMLSRNMQRSFVGETPIWMSKEMGKLMTQFRTFSIASIEKQVAAGLRGDKIGMFLKVMFGLMIGTGAYSSRAWIRAQNDEDPEGKWAQYTDPHMMATGIANMTPHMGLIGMGMELSYVSGLVDSEGDSVASRSGQRPLSVEGLVPAVGVGMDAINAGRGMLRGAGSQDSEVFMENFKDAIGMAPMMNTAAVGAAMAIANKATD